MEFKQKLFIVLIGFMGACTHKTDSYNFEPINTVKIDESKLVLTRYPSQVDEINDSVVALVNSYESISLYNIYSGKNILNFSVKNINFDSLMRATFQKKYNGVRTYTYNSSSEGISGEGGQIKSFQYYNNDFYIHTSTMVQVSYLKDSAAILGADENIKIEQLKQKYGAVKLTVMDYMNFLFVTDGKFNLKKIIPLYESPKLKTDHYFPIYERAFLVNENDVYVYLSKDNEVYETMRTKKQPQANYLAKIDLKDENNTQYFLNKEEIDFSDFTIHDYYAAPIKLTYSDNNIIYSNCKELCDVESGEKIFSKKKLLSNEWIAGFYKHIDKIVMVNYNADKKENPSEFDVQYALDSLNTARIKVYDSKTAEWSNEKMLPAAFHFPFLVSSSKIIFFDKDKQNYYFKYVRYNEN